MAAQRTVARAPDVRGVGRPRQHAAETEKALILDAAYRVLSEGGGASITIADILHAAGLSTRSFYRHFQSKDQLLREMYLRDAERAAARLAARVQKAHGSREAVAVWIDEIFGFTTVRARAERVAVISSAIVEGVEGSAEVSRVARALLVAPLRAAIERGLAEGTFSAGASPDDDVMIAAVVFDAAGLSALRRNGAPLNREAARSFCFRALGAERA